MYRNAQKNVQTDTNGKCRELCRNHSEKSRNQNDRCGIFRQKRKAVGQDTEHDIDISYQGIIHRAVPSDASVRSCVYQAEHK